MNQTPEIFTGPLGSWKLVTTQDGSQTLWSEHFQEQCHSHAGARAETQYQFIEGCHIRQKAKQGPLNILDVGHGPGWGVIETFQSLDSDPLLFPIHLISLEIAPELLEFAKSYFSDKNWRQFPKHADLQIVSKWDEGTWLMAQKGPHTLSILLGDATKLLPLFLSIHELKFHAIYQDAFSPKKNEALWNVEWFSLLKKWASPDCILSTYSASSLVQKNLLSCGWNVVLRKGFGPKKSATRACLNSTVAQALK